MNKDELLRKVDVYAGNVAEIIAASGVDLKTKALAKQIADETCQMMNAILRDLET